MEWWVTIAISFGGIFVFLGLGFPVAVAFLALDIIGLYLLRGTAGLGLIAGSMFDSVGSFTMAAVPLFYFLGELLFQSKAIDVILNAVDAWIGKVRARLNVLAVAVGTMLGTLSGSFISDAAILCATLLPEMEKRGYDRKLAVGTIMCSGSLAAIIPPSILIVVIGGLANVSISKLLIGGVAPGLMLAALYILYILIRVKISPRLAPAYDVSNVSFSMKMRTLVATLPFMGIIFLVLGLILLGIATPTESAATGALGAIIVVAFLGRLKVDILKKTLIQTMTLSGMLFFIIAGSKAFSQLLAISGASKGLVESIVQLDASPVVMYIILNLLVLLLGCFLEAFSIMMITIPIFCPIVKAFGYEPISFWLCFLINILAGGITPPFGIIVFTVKGAAPHIPILDIYRGGTPFVFLMILGMVLVAVFPGIALWLPNLFMD